jgi:hypothetical protein
MEYSESAGLLMLGFDVRQAPGCGAGEWPLERREEFLIRPEVLGPLSVDRSVWPQAAGGFDGAGPLHLWGSVPQILAAHPDLLSRGGPLVIVEITVIAGGRDYERWKRFFEGMLRLELDGTLVSGFHDYGYDVADQFLVSGLINCGLDPEERKAIRRV